MKENIFISLTDIVSSFLNAGKEKTIEKLSHEFILFATKNAEKRLNTLLNGQRNLDRHKEKSPKPQRKRSETQLHRHVSGFKKPVDIIDAEIIP